MDQLEKDSLRDSAQSHVNSVQHNLGREIEKMLAQNENLEAVIHGAVKGSHDEEYTDIEKVMLTEGKQRLDELDKLQKSPYFSKFVLKFDEDNEVKTLYIGKFPFHDDNISSWTTPIAKLRYEQPGKFEYLNLNDQTVRGELQHKDQFMIVDGHIVFMASEGIGQPRELIHQERLARKKSEFVLPEIVEQMEKAQDEVIRANWKGSFLISGPAGSGKTTLALHRVAYLTQAPETESIFPSLSIIVFVQDASTKAYFSNLLPELGIKKVTIVTFDEWIIEKLKLKDVKFVQKYGRNEKEKDLYEYSKNLALKTLEKNPPKETFKSISSVFGYLRDFYSKTFSEELLKLFQHQQADRMLDRFDLSFLGKCVIMQEGAIHEDKAEYELLKHMKFKKTIKRVPLNYSLIVVDEAENFLQEQIEILLSAVSRKTKAMLYVGDLAQKTRAYTIEDWNLVGESFGEGRKVILQKVYRNTKQILEYIQSVGFKTTIPEGVNTGKEVQELVIGTKAQEIEKVEEIIESRDGGVVGIVSKTDEYLEAYRKVFNDRKDVKILTINEAQGVEFDAVFLVGVDPQYFGRGDEMSYSTEQRHVNRDLLYVALTRAMNELYVFGRVPLKELIAELK
jgi:DNA helicase IV